MRRRINVGVLFGALDSKRGAEGLSWRELARQLALSPSVFTRLGQGARPDVDTFLTLTGWLGISPERFAEGSAPLDEDTLAVISTYLRADKALPPKSAAALEAILRTAYERLAER
jgi:transcriptional regulator with XRE-family HTH domain